MMKRYLRIQHSNGVTQTAEIIEQDFYDLYRDLNEKDEKKLTSEDKVFLEENSWVKDLIKNRKIVTTRSPIYLTHLKGDGVLDLSPNQGIHFIKTEEFTS